MKRIAIFCDGAWNGLDRRRETSVLRLARAVPPTAPDGTKQVGIYLPGVSAGRGSAGVVLGLDRLFGAAFGWGLTETIEEAFRALIFIHEPGDEIHILGFSRGAYTARSLAGLIRAAGIPLRAQAAAIPEAIAHYRARGPETHPNAEVSFRFRLRVSPHLVTSPEEAAWRRGTGAPEAPLLKVAYLGVWDTVGALGLPGVFGSLTRLVNRQYAFHDADLTRLVAAARHAVALDERRRFHPPTLWENLDMLNGGAEGEARRYLQLWFPGNHGIVGGSGGVPGLGAAAALWIAQGAAAEGLAFEPGTLEALADEADPLADGAPLAQRAGPVNLLGLWLADRDGPDRADDVSATARARVAGLPAYRPASLRRVLDALA